jgi:hypothetical protein
MSAEEPGSFVDAPVAVVATAVLAAVAAAMVALPKVPAVAAGEIHLVAQVMVALLWPGQ